MARCAGIAGRHVQTRVLREEVARAQEAICCQRLDFDRSVAKMGTGGYLHCHRLRRHYGEVLRRWEVCESEGVPQHDVLVVEVCVWVRGDPGGDALGGLAGGLGDVATGGVKLAVFVWRTVC